jgi:hypothetical protein
MNEPPKTPFGLGADINRGNEVRRDTDTYKTPSITIYDVDYAIMYYLRNTIGLRVEQNSRMIDVPLVYGSGELWSQVQQKGYMRDKEGKLLVPYAVISRTGMSEDERFRRVDTNLGPDPLQVYITRPTKGRSFNNTFDLHRETVNSKFSDTYYISVIPEFYVLEYELVLYTRFNEQMNSLVEAIIPASQFVWGDSYMFRTVVGDFSFETVSPSTEERIVKATTSLTVDARLQGEFELKQSTIRKRYGIKRVVFPTERSSFDIYPVDRFPTDL